MTLTKLALAPTIAAAAIGFGLVAQADTAPATGTTCLAQAQALEVTTSQLPDGDKKTKVLSRLHKAEKAAENDPNSSDCKHYLQRAKTGLGL